MGNPACRTVSRRLVAGKDWPSILASTWVMGLSTPSSSI